MTKHHKTTFRHKLATALDPALRGHGLSPLNLGLIGVMTFSIFMAFLETEKSIHDAYQKWFMVASVVLTCLLICEYIARIWVSCENPKYRHRWHYVMTWSALLDLLTIILMILTPIGAKSFILRLAQMVSLLRIARLGHYSLAIKHIRNALHERKDELLISFGMAFIALIVSSTILYFLERNVQPVKFGSIPRSMWWAICTLTTVGYGDVYPITPLGKFFAGLTAIAGIGLIALPAGILAASFSDALQRIRKTKKSATDRRQRP